MSTLISINEIYSINQTSFVFLINLLLRHFDTSITYRCEGGSSNLHYNLENIIHETIFQNQKTVISVPLDLDNVFLDGLRKSYVNKRILNIFLIIVEVTPNVLNHLDRIYSQSNQYDVGNIIVLFSIQESHKIKKFIANKFEHISNTLLVLPDESVSQTIWSYRNHTWFNLNITNSLHFQDILNRNIDFNGQEINIHFEEQHCSSYLLILDKQPMFVGHDAFVGTEIYDRFNAKPFYYSSILKLLPKPILKFAVMKKIEKELIIRKRMNSNFNFTSISTYGMNFARLLFDLRKLDNLFISLDVDLNYVNADIRITPSVTTNTKQMDFLYPHDREYVQILVPKRGLDGSFITATITSNEAIVFGIVLMLFWILRLILHQVHVRNWIAALIDTLSFSLAQQRVFLKGGAEKFWLLNVAISSILFMVLLSALSFKNLMIHGQKHVSNVDEFLETDLQIMTFDQLKSFMEYMSPELQKRTTFSTTVEIFQAILNENQQYAYVLPEEVMHFIHRKYLIQANKFGRDIYYQMKEPLFSHPYSYQVAHNSPLTHKANEIVQGMIEFGFIGIYKKWTKDMFNLQTEVTSFALKDFNSSLTFEKVLGVMYVYVTGITVSCLVFIYEVFVLFCLKKS